MAIELCMVMPVYNEVACVAGVVGAWREMLERLGVEFRMLVLNDGSTDGTETALRPFEDDGRIDLISKQNSGHGPTILEGYHRAVELADWVFQCDSDDEMKPGHFPALWAKRDEYDALFGVRVGRRQSPTRGLISAVSRLTVRMLFGSGVCDVNTPYRLMRAALLREIIVQIPPDTFAPNVIISGAFARAGKRILNTPVPHEGRRTGAVSVVKWRLWRAVIKAFWQTLLCRPVVKGVSAL